MRKRGVCLIFFVFLAAALIVGSDENKVDERVLKELSEKGSADVIVAIKEEPVRILGIFKTKDPRETLSEDELNKTHDFSLVKGFSGEITKEGLEKLVKNPNVEKVYFDEAYKLHLQDSVPLVNATNSISIQVNGINVTGYGQAICILDTGINYSHSDFGSCSASSFSDGTCSKVPDGYDYVNSDNDPVDGQGHGTHVAGIAAANGTIKGVAPGAKVIAIKVCNDDIDSLCASSAIYSGLEWCINNATIYNITVISMSFGSPILYSSYCDNIDLTMTSYINFVIAKNITVVVSTGNDGSTSGIGSPACIQNSTAVGAVTKANAIIYNRNSITDLLAPGQNINSTSYTGLYEINSGTSMATPHVSGAVAVLQSYKKLEDNRLLTPYEAQNALNQTGLSIVDTGGSGLTFQRINLVRALWFIDSKVPALFSEGMSHTLVYNYSNVTFFANATDTNLDEVWLSLNISGNTTIFAVTDKAGVTYNFTVDEGNFTPNSFVQWRFGANDTNNNINYTVWHNFTVQSGAPTITLNSPSDNTYANSAEVIFNFTASDDKDVLLNCTLKIDGFNNATNGTSNNGTSTIFRINLTGLSHNWTVFCSDNDTNNLTSPWQIFTIDLTTPQLMNITFNSTIELGDAQLITVNVSDLYFDYVNISREGVNTTMALLGAIANYSFVPTLNGTMPFVIYAFDLASNFNVSNYTFAVNDSAPQPRILTPKLANATIAKNAVQTVSAWVVDSNPISSVMINFNGTNITMANNTYYNYTYSWNTSGCGTNNYTIIANDSIGDFIDGNFNFTTILCCGNNICESGESCSSCSGDCGACQATTSGGGGGGGGAGGLSTPLNKVTHTFPKITPDEPMLGKITNPEFEVTGIKLDVKNESRLVRMEIERLAEKPEDASPLPRAYKYLSINAFNLKDENIREAIISFRVNRTWVHNNGFDKNLVRLYRLTSKWEEMPTILVNSTANHFFFEASTKGFSYFAIGVREEEKYVIHEQEQNNTVTGSFIETKKEEPQAMPGEQSLDYKRGVITALIMLAVIIGLLVAVEELDKYHNTKKS